MPGCGGIASVSRPAVRPGRHAPVGARQRHIRAGPSGPRLTCSRPGASRRGPERATMPHSNPWIFRKDQNYAPPVAMGTHARFDGGGPPEFPMWPSRHPDPATPGGSSPLHLQVLRGFHGLRPFSPGSAPPCPPHRRDPISERQDSAISRTGCRFARRPQATLSRRFDAGISPARRPPATRLLGRYLGRTCTGWSHGASSRYTR